MASSYQHFVLADGLAYVLYAGLATRSQREGARQAGDVEQEVGQHLLALRRQLDLRETIYMLISDEKTLYQFLQPIIHRRV